MIMENGKCNRRTNIKTSPREAILGPAGRDQI